MKREAKILDGTPDKRLFWSIIQDYSLETSICELTDNALDLYLRGKQTVPVFIKIELDFERQIVRIEDNAGGVKESDLDMLIKPGGTGNRREEEVIGIFGVGGKRAVVALGENTTIVSRYEASAASYRIDIDNDWLESNSWDIPAYIVEPIAERTTIVEVSKLRRPITTEDEIFLRQHLSSTYAVFLTSRKFMISLNGTGIKPVTYDKWAYPPKFLPRRFRVDLPAADNEIVRCEIVGGLVHEKDPGGDDYGVYFYCNDRLIAKELKDRSVGYITGRAGIPHSDASLCGVLVFLRGSAKHMPWNSTKSAIVYSHATFQAIQNVLIEIVSDYSSLSRRLREVWKEEVFAYSVGKPIEVRSRGLSRSKSRTFHPCQR